MIEFILGLTIIVFLMLVIGVIVSWVFDGIACISSKLLHKKGTDR